MKTKRFLSLIVMCALLATTFILPSSVLCASKATTWRFSTNQNQPTSYQFVKGFKPFTESVAKLTDRKLLIHLYLIGELGLDAKDFLGVIKANGIDMGEGSSSYYSKTIQMMYMLDLPGLASTIQDKVKMFDYARPDLEKELAERFNAKLLFMAPWPGTFVVTKKEVPNILNWKGLKIRASATSAQDQIIRCGGDSFYMPGSELYSGLEKGVIDGVISSIDWFLQFNLQEQVKYLYMVPFGIQFYFGVVNLDAFKSLPADVQKIVMDEARKIEPILIEEANKVNSNGAEAFKKAGVKVVYPNKKELDKWREKAQMPLWGSAYKSWRPDTLALFNKITKALDINFTP